MRWGAAVLVGAMVACGPGVGSPDAETEAEATSTGVNGSTSTPPGDSTGEPPDTTSGVLDVPWGPDLPDPSVSDGDADTGSCTPWAFEGCATGLPPMSTITGTTPLAEDDGFGYAFFASDAWCDSCVTSSRLYRIILVRDPSVVAGLAPWETPTEGLVIELDDFEGPVGEPLPASVAAYRDGVQAGSASGTFSIDAMPEPSELGEPYDPTAPAIVHGTLTVTAAEWDLEGTFSAAYCPALNGSAICE